MTLPPNRRPPHPYARRHLASHAAAGGRLDDILNLETLPYLDEARLSTLLRLTEPAPLSPQWLLLSAFRSIRHRWSWDDPDGNAAALDVAYRAVDAMAPLPDRSTASGLAWKPRLADWQSGGTIVAGDERGLVRLTIGAVRGAPILVTGDDWSVQLWDPATGQPIGERLGVVDQILALALAEGPGLVLAACDGGRVIGWDAVTHLKAVTVDLSDQMPTALAVGAILDRWMVAAGGASGVVELRWIDDGMLIGEFRADIPARKSRASMPVRAVALAQTEDGRLHLAVGLGNEEQGWIAVYDVSSEEPHPGISVDGEINDVALALMEGQLVLAAAVSGRAGTWDARSGAPLAAIPRHNERLSSVALAAIGGQPLLATGSYDRTARLWGAFHGEPMESPLPHPAPVDSVAFGEIDGRTMLVTGCLDGNTRLWDPLRASGARVAVEGWFSSVAMDADVLVAGSEDGQVRLWDIASGAVYSLLPAEPGYEAPYEPPYALDGMKVLLAGTRPRLLLTQHRDRVAIWDWDVSDPGQLTSRQQTEIGTMRGSDLHVARGVPLLASLDHADQVSVVELLSGRRLFRTEVFRADSLRLIDAPDHPLLAVGAGRTLHLLDVDSGRRVRDPLPLALPRHAAVGSLDGANVLATLDADGLRLYDLRTGELTIPPVEMSSTASGIAWGRVGDRDVVVTAHFATVRVWNPRTGRKITELRVGTRIGAMSVRQTDGDRLLVAVSGPGLVLTELREISS
jgi:WD40 repeat protein